MATLGPEQMQEVALAVDLGDRLTLIVIFGPGYLAKSGLADVRDGLGSDRKVVQHMLHRRGPDIAETVAESDDPRPLVLVSGFDRVPSRRRQGLLTSLNLLRDTLNKRPATIVLWVPTEIADDFRQTCVDLFQWRTVTVYVEDPELEQTRLRYLYLTSLANTEFGAAALHDVDDERYVRVEDEETPMGVDAWLDSVRRGVLVGPLGSGKSTVLRRYAALRAAEILDFGDRERPVPVLICAREVTEVPLNWRTLLAPVTSGLDGGTSAWLTEQLIAEPAVLLLDGVDQLPSESAQWLEAQRMFAGNPRLRIVLSSRTLDPWRSLFFDPLKKAELLPLAPDAFERALRNIGRDPEPIMEALVSLDALPLLRNPLSLEVIISHASRLRSEIELDLTEVTGDIAQKWLVSSSSSRLRGHQIFLGSASDKRRALVDLAASLLNDGPTRYSPALDHVATTTGLVRRDTSTPKWRYWFVEKTFLDYFAGCWLADQAPSPDQLAAHAADPTWRIPTMHALRLIAPDERERGAESIWRAAQSQPPATRWAMRKLVLRAMLSDRDFELRQRFVSLTSAAVQQACRDGEPASLWAEVATLLDRVDAA